MRRLACLFECLASSSISQNSLISFLDNLYSDSFSFPFFVYVLAKKVWEFCQLVNISAMFTCPPQLSPSIIISSDFWGMLLSSSPLLVQHYLKHTINRIITILIILDRKWGGGGGTSVSRTLHSLWLDEVPFHPARTIGIQNFERLSPQSILGHRAFIGGHQKSSRGVVPPPM